MAASSKLAGRYVPEMVDNLKAAGIDVVELDYVQGRPVFSMEIDQIEGMIEEFREAEIRIAGLRVPAVTEDDQALLDAIRWALERGFS